MNCKPGDLAVIVRADHKENIGALVEVLRPNDLPVAGWLAASGLFLWRVKASARPLSVTRILGECSVIEAACPDAFLRPIRPGDISDEEVRDLYAPKLPEVA